MSSRPLLSSRAKGGICFSALLLTVACSSGTPGGATARGQVGTLAAVRSRGAVKCGITQGAGFGTPDDAGRWRGFDVDFCRALAVALFNDADKVQFIPYTQQQRFSGLESGEVDLLVNGTSLTSSRALHQPLHFGPVYFYDGQGFLVPRSSRATRAGMLDGATICVQQ